MLISSTDEYGVVSHIYAFSSYMFKIDLGQDQNWHVTNQLCFFFQKFETKLDLFKWLSTFRRARFKYLRCTVFHTRSGEQKQQHQLKLTNDKRKDPTTVQFCNKWLYHTLLGSWSEWPKDRRYFWQWFHILKNEWKLKEKREKNPVSRFENNPIYPLG